MKKESIIAAAINRGFESGKLMDAEYLLAESQKLSDRFAEIVNDTAKEDWPLVILMLERVAQGLRSHIPESGGRCVDSGSVSYMRRRENDG